MQFKPVRVHSAWLKRLGYRLEAHALQARDGCIVFSVCFQRGVL